VYWIPLEKKQIIPIQHISKALKMIFRGAACIFKCTHLLPVSWHGAWPEWTTKLCLVAVHIAVTRPWRWCRWHRHTVHDAANVTAVHDKLVAVPCVDGIQSLQPLLFEPTSLRHQRITSQRSCLPVVSRQPMTAVVRSQLSVNIFSADVQHRATSLQLTC